MTFTKWRQSATLTWWQAGYPTGTDKRLVSFLIKDTNITAVSSLRKLKDQCILRVVKCVRNYRNLCSLSSQLPVLTVSTRNFDL